MECKTVEEIIDRTNEEEYPESTFIDIVEGFLIYFYKKYKIKIDKNSEQYKNIYNLLKVLYYPLKKGFKKPIVMNIPMGQGKSSVLNYFFRELYGVDFDLSAIVVKKKLDECSDFATKVGFRNGFKLYDSDGNREDKDIEEFLEAEYVKQEYEGKLIGTSHGEIKYKNEKDFIVRVVRGFNFDDCEKWRDKNKGIGIIRNGTDYDFRLCSQCNTKHCNARFSKAFAQEHSIISISHARLFFGMSIIEILDKLLEYKRFDGTKKRKYLIIDEKIDTVESKSITHPDFLDVMKIVKQTENDKWIELFQKIEDSYFTKYLPPEKESSGINKYKVESYDKTFSFDEDLLKIFMNPATTNLKDLENLMIIQNIMQAKYITASRKYIPFTKYESRPKQISYYKYIDLIEYSKHFEKTIILDATALLDYDIKNSDAVFCKDIILNKPELSLFLPIQDCRVNKKSIVGKYYTEDEKKEFDYKNNMPRIALQLHEILKFNKEKKILIVVYKSISSSVQFDFKSDIKNEIKAIIKENKENYKFEIIHHGEFTTGVNTFLDFETLIIVGQLDKSHVFYQNKALAIGYNINDYKKIRINDFVIDTIQQIGRTAMRRKKSIDVYLFNNEKDNQSIIKELENYFKINYKTFNNDYYNWERKKGNKRVITMLKDLNQVMHKSF